MNKIFTFALMAMALGAPCAHAADYSENQLLGYWEVVSTSGCVSPGIRSFDGIYFGEVYWDYDYDADDTGDDDFFKLSETNFWNGDPVNQDTSGYFASAPGFIENADGPDVTSVSDGYSGDRAFPMVDFSITGGNRLHIISFHSIRFEIEELTASTLKLKTYMSPKPCSITLKKSNKFAGVTKVEADQTDAAVSSYDIEGRRVSDSQKGLVIERKGAKAMKLLRR